LLKVSNGSNKQIINLKFTDMNTLKNSVNLIGNLGLDPEVTNLENGGMLVKFSVATKDSYKDKNGEWQDRTEWHRVIAWGKAAELCGKLLKKGANVVIEGKLENDSYTDKDGNKRYATQIRLREFMVMNREKTEKN
jgi:single-strand DNA-binding protein